MRRILIILLIICLLVGTAIGGAWWYLQRSLAALSITDLDYRIGVLSYKHMRLDQVSFTYVGENQLLHTNPTSDQTLPDAYLGNMLEGEAYHVPVQLDDVFITWEWHAFRPQVQIIEVGRLDVSLDRWPQPQLSTSPNHTWRDWQLPEDWHVPEALPHRLKIDQFALQLPCADADKCSYSGSIAFTSKNKERFLQTDKPQNSSLTVRLSPHQHFSEIQHIHLQVDYDVVDELPVFSMALISPMAFNLHWSQRLTPANHLLGELELHYEPTGEWLFDHAAKWLPTLPSLTTPLVTIINDSFQLTTDYQLQLPGTALQRWPDEAEGELNLSAKLQDQISLDGRFGLQRNDEIEVNARIHGQIENAFVQQVFRQLPFEWVPKPRQPGTPINLQTLGDSPGLLLSQWGNTLDLSSYLQLHLPPGVSFTSWASQAAGRFDYTVEPVIHYVADLATFRTASHGRIEFDAGVLNNVDVALHSEVVPALKNSSLAKLGVDIERLSIALQIQQDEPSLWDEIPLALQISSQGDTRVSVTVPAQLGMAPLSLASESAMLHIQQPSLQIGNVHLTQSEVTLPFAFSVDRARQFRLRSQAEGRWTVNRAQHQPPNETSVTVALNQLRGSINNWQVIGHIDNFAATQLSATLDTQAERLEAPYVQPVSWRHQAEIAGQPLAEGPQLQLSGQLSNAPGLSVRHQALLSARQFSLDWQLADIFWLAGNPLVPSFEGWPALLQIERGRTSASGSVILPFAADQPLQMTSSLLMRDVAGIYDTFLFNGLNAEIDVDVADDVVNVSLDKASLQRFEAGIAMGPAQLSAHYQGPLTAPMDGQLVLGENQLNLLNGTVSLRPERYQLDHEDFTFYVDLSQLDIAQLLAEYPATDIQGSGLISGVLPVQWTPAGFSIDEGVVASHPPGGKIQYRSERAKQMAESNRVMEIVMQALDDFHYSELSGTVGYNEAGTLSLGLVLEGQNPDLEQGRPIRMEVDLEEDLPALLTSLQLVNQLNDVIQERVQQRLIERLRN